MTEKEVEQINVLGKDTKQQGFQVIVVSNNPIPKLTVENCFMDQTTMKTIIRSNPGFMVLEKGTVKAKYHYNDMPTVNQLQNLFN